MERKLFAKEQDYWSSAFSLVYIILVALVSYCVEIRQVKISNIPVFDMVILAFATFRLIRLFTYDYVMKYIRDYFDQFQKGPRRTLADLLDCPWCTGMWMALLVVLLYVLSPVTKTFLFILALAGMATYLQIIIWKIGLEPEEKK